MPIYLRTTTNITPPPSSELSSDDETQFVRDPSQVFDILPQPYRMINKIVMGVFDDAWDIIAEREADRRRKEAKYIPPGLDASRIITNPGAVVNGVRASNDGSLIFAALNGGIAAIECASESLVAFTEWQTGEVQYDVLALFGGHSISVVVRDRPHLLYPVCALDATGTLRLFLYVHTLRSFLPIKTWTPTVEPQNAVSTQQQQQQQVGDDESTKKLMGRGAAEFSSDLEYLALHVYDIKGVSCDSFVEVYRIAKENWAHEAEMLLTAHQDGEAQQPEAVESPDPQPTKPSPDSADPAAPPQFLEPTLMLKIKPANVPPYVNMSSSLSSTVGKTGRGVEVPATGESHLITQLHLDRRSAEFEYANAHLMTYLVPDDSLKPPKVPSMMFLGGGRILPISNESMADSNESTTSLAVWWTGGFQLFVYSLLRQNKDMSPTLEACIPFSSPISSTASSPCSSLLAVLLENETVVVWDKLKGIKRKVLNLNDVMNRSAQRRVVSLCFLESSRLWNELASKVMRAKLASSRSTISTELLRRKQLASGSVGWENNVQLLISFSSGSVYLVNTQIDPDSTFEDQASLARNDVVRIHEPSEPDYPGLSQCFYLRALPGLICLVRQDGRMFVHDVLKPRTNAICELTIPDGYELSMSWKDVIATASQGARLLARVSSTREERHDDFLVFEFKYSELLGKYSNRAEKYDVPTDLEQSKKRFNMQESLDTFVTRCIDERMSSLSSRQTQFKSWWTELQSAKRPAPTGSAQQRTRAAFGATPPLDMRIYSVMMSS